MASFVLKWNVKHQNENKNKTEKLKNEKKLIKKIKQTETDYKKKSALATVVKEKTLEELWQKMSWNLRNTKKNEEQRWDIVCILYYIYINI